MKIFRNLLMMSLFCCGANSSFAQTWTETGASETNTWTAVASSADGTKLVAAASVIGSGIWISTNSGAAWTLTSASKINDWWQVASSADGTKLVAMDNYYGVICTSADSGATWIKCNLPDWKWNSIALSADGTKLVASASDPTFNEYIFTSSDSGMSWTSNCVPGSDAVSVATSPDGNRLVAASAGYVLTSTNSGATWQCASSCPVVSLTSVACSANGSTLVTGGNSLVFVSTNSGATWNSNYISALGGRVVLRSFASSVDGNTLAAVATSANIDFKFAGVIFVSTNSGTTWTQANAPIKDWTMIFCTADGCKFVASAAPSVSPFPSTQAGGIYSSQTTPAPSMNIVPRRGNLTVSWLVPSTNFAMQQSPDLLNWTDMTNQPVLNFTNLENEVVLPPTGSNVFYRLKTP
jgi:hypothetical protein